MAFLKTKLKYTKKRKRKRRKENAKFTNVFDQTIIQ